MNVHRFAPRRVSGHHKDLVIEAARTAHYYGVGRSLHFWESLLRSGPD